MKAEFDVPDLPAGFVYTNYIDAPAYGEYFVDPTRTNLVKKAMYDAEDNAIGLLVRMQMPFGHDAFVLVNEFRIPKEGEWFLDYDESDTDRIMPVVKQCIGSMWVDLNKNWEGARVIVTMQRWRAKHGQMYLTLEVSPNVAGFTTRMCMETGTEINNLHWKTGWYFRTQDAVYKAIEAANEAILEVAKAQKA